MCPKCFSIKNNSVGSYFIGGSYCLCDSEEIIGDEMSLIEDFLDELFSDDYDDDDEDFYDELYDNLKYDDVIHQYYIQFFYQLSQKHHQ
jgi:hypothetical protein